MKVSTCYFCLIVFFLLVSCKKEQRPLRVDNDEEERQTLTMLANHTRWEITSTSSKDRERLRGQLTGLQEKDSYTSMYTVTALKKLGEGSEQFRIQIFGINGTGVYKITGKDSYYSSFGTFVAFSKRSSNATDDLAMYAIDSTKTPFTVEINKYEIPYGSIVPTVGGRFDGVLYNVSNPKDSIKIENGKFEVRY